MNVSDTGLALIKKWEGFRARPYLCPGNIWTIGYGHTRNVTQNTRPISETEALALLVADLRQAEDSVLRLTKAPLHQNQFDALVSFVFNLGGGAYQRSTLRAQLNRGGYDDAAREFRKWVYAGGKKLPGLIARRADEEALFRSGREVEALPLAGKHDAVPAQFMRWVYAGGKKLRGLEARREAEAGTYGGI